MKKIDLINSKSAITVRSDDHYEGVDQEAVGR